MPQESPPPPAPSSPPPTLASARGAGEKISGATRAAREWATQGTDLGVGWKRTLPAAIAANATWFSRERTLEAIFEDVGVGEVVWLTFANSAFREFTLNWAAHVYRIRKERAAAIAALDLELQRSLLEEGLPYFGYDHGRTGDLRSDVVEFRRLGALKGELVLRVLRSDRHVLLSDVDVVWLHDPTPILATLATDADVMSATDCLHVSGDEAKFPKIAQGVNRCAYNPGNENGTRRQMRGAAAMTGEGGGHGGGQGAWDALGVGWGGMGRGGAG